VTCVLPFDSDNVIKSCLCPNLFPRVITASAPVVQSKMATFIGAEWDQRVLVFQETKRATKIQSNFRKHYAKIPSARPSTCERKRTLLRQCVSHTKQSDRPYETGWCVLTKRLQLKPYNMQVLQAVTDAGDIVTSHIVLKRYTDSKRRSLTRTWNAIVTVRRWMLFFFFWRHEWQK
jgi:hypothetical protein